MGDQRFKSILLFGAPGTGKGTQGAILGRVPGFVHLSTGEIFRNLDRDSEIGRIFAQYSTRGELVPDDVTIRMFREFVGGQIDAGSFKPASQILLLDGVPRSANQARLLADHIDVLKIICLTCEDDAEMVKRLRKRALTQDRPDDAREDVIRRRLEVYREETLPVLAEYPGDAVAEVDAIGTPGEVLERVLAIVNPIQKMAFAPART